MTTTGGKQFGAHEFLRTAGVHDGHAGIVQVIENELFVGNRIGIECDLALTGVGEMNRLFGGASFMQPGIESAIEQ